MLFKPDLLEKVLSGEKTQTRRLFKPGDASMWNDKKISWVSDRNCRLRFSVGSIVAAQPGRGQKGQGFIQITAIGRQDVRYISLSDAHAEGFPNEIEFWAVWCAMHDKSFFFRREKRGMFAETTYRTVVDLCRELALRPAERYHAWALTFELVK